MSVVLMSYNNDSDDSYDNLTLYNISKEEMVKYFPHSRAIK